MRLITVTKKSNLIGYLAPISFRFISLFIILLFNSAAIAATQGKETFSRAEVESDFNSMLEFVKTTHPDLQYSTDSTKLENAVESIKNSFHGEMSITDVWLAFSRLNPLFGDAHVGIRRPVGRLETYQGTGGRLFPMDVLIDSDGIMRVADDGFIQYLSERVDVRPRIGIA